MLAFSAAESGKQTSFLASPTHLCYMHGEFSNYICCVRETVTSSTLWLYLSNTWLARK